MGRNIKQVYDANPSTTSQNNDLIYLGRSPYGSTNNTAILTSDFIAQLQANLDFIHTTGAVALGDVPIYGADGKNAKSSGINVSVGRVISNVADPIIAQDVSTKNYTDTGLALKLNLSGGTMSGAIDMGTHQIHNVTDPTSAQDAATKNYTQAQTIPANTSPVNYTPTDSTIKGNLQGIDNALGASPVDSFALTGCALAAIGNFSATYNNGASGVGATLTATSVGALSFDNGVPQVGDRILIPAQTSALQNGIYTVTVAGDGATNGVLTRAADFNKSSNMLSGCYTAIASGSQNNSKVFAFYTTGPVTVGTDSIPFSSLYAGLGVTSSIGYLRTQWIDFVSSATLKGAIYAKNYHTSNAALALVSENIAGSASLITYSIPSTSGATAPYIGKIKVIWGNTGGWKIQLNSGDIAYIGNSLTTSGGSISSTDSGDSIAIELAAPQIWVATSIVGNPSAA